MAASTGRIAALRSNDERQEWAVRNGNDNGTHYPYPDWDDRQRGSMYPQIASSVRSLPTTPDSCLKKKLTAHAKD